ncbi:hypothetical protein MD484_g7062, partial [Candolleomyces efflorescens]
MAVVAHLLLFFAQILAVAFAAPVNQTLENRQSAVSALSADEVAGYKPYTWYASTAGCNPTNTSAWNCGTKCSANPTFIPIASGGDGGKVQYWFVGFDPSLQTIIVSYQGTDPSKITPLITVLRFALTPLRSTLFPGVSSSLQTHDGFGDAHAASAEAVLAAVRSGLSKYGVNKVTLTGHSLGGSIAIIATAHLAIHIPGVSLRTITYANPRVGNQAFVDFVNARSEMTRITNRRDIVPILPGRFVGFAHTRGEVHIVNSGAWISCPGQDNTNSECLIGYVPTLFNGNADDHVGPYDGITFGGC